MMVGMQEIRRCGFEIKTVLVGGVVVVVDPFVFRFVINEHLSLDPRVCYCNSELL